jgi:predicted nucleic acid-binding protein
MLVVVPDVNVLVSAQITPTGPAGRIMDSWRRDEIEFVTSAAIISKVDQVLHRPHLLNTYPIDENDLPLNSVTLYKLP